MSLILNPRHAASFSGGGEASPLTLGLLSQILGLPGLRASSFNIAMKMTNDGPGILKNLGQIRHCFKNFLAELGLLLYVFMTYSGQ